LQQEVDHLLEAKQRWFKQGDRNTGYFHAWATHHRKTNHIAEIRDESGHQWTSPGVIRGLFSQYFQQLFTTSGGLEVEGVLEAVSHNVTPKMNAALLRPFQQEELKEALFQM
jgi:hypothetical protein